MLRICTLFVSGSLLVTLAAAQNMPLVEENSSRVSDHVYAIVGFPNIGIVVGSRATLVIDTGLGPRNGATIVRVAKKLASNQKLFLTTTHFHPEHAAGEAGFPADTILIRPAAQQREVETSAADMISRFSAMSPQNHELLAGVKLRPPDIVFDRELKLDLGGVTARLLWFGQAHTKGDEVIFVEPDSTLVPGDVVQDKLVPRVNPGEGSPKSWLAVLDQIAPLQPRHVLPDHGGLGDGSLVQKERAFIDDLRTRALALKREGVSAPEAGKRLTTEFTAKYAGWGNLNLVPTFVDRVYEE
ncbi:MAG TPA: MBL fold metallo-hydrolase [Bryobacteraceae bacterium]|nr:MBL fold metallo-hydrolase [Bryobacteraceae bacterium]